MRALCATLLLLAVAPVSSAPVAAQSPPRWREIGKTSTGNTVFVDPGSIGRDSTGVITATVRVVFAEPVSTPQGPITGSRAVAMFDCTRKFVAVKENIIWHDERAGTVYRRSAPAQPGFGPALTSTFAYVALEYLCSPGQSRD